MPAKYFTESRQQGLACSQIIGHSKHISASLSLSPLSYLSCV